MLGGKKKMMHEKEEEKRKRERASYLERTKHTRVLGYSLLEQHSLLLERQELPSPMGQYGQ